MVPTGKSSIGSWFEENEAMPQLSSAVGVVQLTSAEQLPMSLDTVMSAGMPSMLGASLSATVTVKEEEVELPAASVAV